MAALLPLAGGLATVLLGGQVHLPDGQMVKLDAEVQCATATAYALVVALDDGRVVGVTTAGTIDVRLDLTGEWIEQVAVSPDGIWLAASTGRTVHLCGRAGEGVRRLEHGSAVQGLAFDPKSKRLAAAHYGGASLWWVGSKDAKPLALPFAGAHLSALWSPDGAYLITALQENALHGWRLADKREMRMSGYPAKVKSVAWTARGRWLATSGAGQVICWPFQGKSGPMGQQPLELFPADTSAPARVSQVAAHPRAEIVAAGYEDGSVRLFRLADGGGLVVRQSGAAPVTALAFSASGEALAFGTADGFVGRLAQPAL